MRRCAVLVLFLVDAVVVVGKCSNLWEVGDAEHLGVGADGAHDATHTLGHIAADARVDFVKHHRVHARLIGGGGLSGQATDIKITAEHILKIRDRMNKILAENTGKPVEQVALDTERDNWLKAEEAKEYGIIDAVITNHEG